MVPGICRGMIDDFVSVWHRVGYMLVVKGVVRNVTRSMVHGVGVRETFAQGLAIFGLGS